jgi:hypothetical protein
LGNFYAKNVVFRDVLYDDCQEIGVSARLTFTLKVFIDNLFSKTINHKPFLSLQKTKTSLLVQQSKIQAIRKI